MYLEDILDISNCTSKVKIIMSDFEDSSDNVTSKQEEVETLMNEGFGNYPHNRASSSLCSSSHTSSNHQPIWDIPDLPLSNPLRETLGTDFSLWRCSLSAQEATSTTLGYEIDSTIYQVFITPTVGRMSPFFIPIIVAHFQVGLHLSIDLAFIDFFDSCSSSTSLSPPKRCSKHNGPHCVVQATWCLINP